MDACSVVRVDGPLAGLRDGFRAELAVLGYTPLSAANWLRVMAHLSRWMAAERIDLGDLTPQCVGQFLAVRRECGYVCWLSERGLAPLLDYLRGQGVVPVPVAAVAGGPVGQILAGYRTYLAEERGLVAATICRYETDARLFLDRHVSALDSVTAGDVTGFVLAECAVRSVGTAKLLVTRLRSLLRFLLLQGLIATDLRPAVPPVAGWRGSHLPKAVKPEQVRLLLTSCDRSRPVGRRDYAMLMLLSRLGLRACEVAALELSDIDWRRGEMVIRGKGRRDERLPLPVDAGEALADHLRRDRLPGRWRQVFLKVLAPAGPMTAEAVKRVVAAACVRAGLPRISAHRLRHSTATDLLRHGAPLAEVGQLLRHRSAQTTAIYAKVDLGALRELARPWPGA